MENLQQKVNDEVARVIGQQTIELASQRVENASLRAQVAALKPPAKDAEKSKKPVGA